MPAALSRGDARMATTDVEGTRALDPNVLLPSQPGDAIAIDGD